MSVKVLLGATAVVIGLYIFLSISENEGTVRLTHATTSTHSFAPGTTASEALASLNRGATTFVKGERAVAIRFVGGDVVPEGEPLVKGDYEVVTTSDRSWRLSLSDTPASTLPASTTDFDRIKKVLMKYPSKRKPLNTRSLTSASFGNVRPSPADRKFSSPVVEELISLLSSRIKDDDLAQLFANTFPNTLDTTVKHFDESKPDTFIITGDITAQWLRDSTNQVLPYIPFAANDARLKALLCGLVRRQTSDVLIDPYANAFNYDTNLDTPELRGWQKDKRTPKMQPKVFEGKYELDSLCAIMKLSSRYFFATKDTQCFGSTWEAAMVKIMDTIETQMKSTDEEGDHPPYRFQRSSQELHHDGRGAPAKRTGMCKSGFRPSDDPCRYPFLVPANAMAVTELRNIQKVMRSLRPRDPTRYDRMIARAGRIEATIEAGVRKYGMVKKANGPIFAYEVDGFGHRNLMDDANLPSLLSLPYLGYVDRTDADYLRTREFVWSTNNTWFSKGTVASGIGGPHCGYGTIWPMSIIMRALTSTSDEEIAESLKWIVYSSAETGLLHESFRKTSAHSFTRKWFAWVNTLFGELILELAMERPHLLF